MEQWIEGFGWYVAFLVSVTCHEASHALAAMKLGDRTAYNHGQVTLDPVPHIQREPWGMVIVPVLSFVMGGWMIGWGSAPAIAAAGSFWTPAATTAVAGARWPTAAIEPKRGGITGGSRARWLRRPNPGSDSRWRPGAKTRGFGGRRNRSDGECRQRGCG